MVCADSTTESQNMLPLMLFENRKSPPYAYFFPERARKVFKIPNWLSYVHSFDIIVDFFCLETENIHHMLILSLNELVRCSKYQINVTLSFEEITISCHNGFKKSNFQLVSKFDYHHTKIV